ENFQNRSLSVDQVRSLFQEFAGDRDITIDTQVMQDIFEKTNGHAGLINICGVALDESLEGLQNTQHIDQSHWGAVENTLLSRMKKYGTFQRLFSDLTEESGRR
ncbi:hypothetical protein BGZ46_006758, partial [Entomortierella lignicola]